MYFRTTAEHEEFRMKVREFAEKEIKPYAFLCDKENKFPSEAVKKMGENSLIIYLVHSLEHNLIPWDMINEQISFQLQLPYMGVRVGTLLLRIALILAITVIIVKIKEQVQGNAREK